MKRAKKNFERDRRKFFLRAKSQAMRKQKIMNKVRDLTSVNEVHAENNVKIHLPKTCVLTNLTIWKE